MISLVRFRRLPHAAGLNPPSQATPYAAGMDICAALAHQGASITIHPGDRALIPTGFEIEIPRGMEGQVRPRSGLAAKYGITVLNAPGTVDSDFRGEMMVILINHGHASYDVNHGDRIAQLVLANCAMALAVEIDGELTGTDRGARGFGSTGV